jgi:hypothetical protein
MTTSVKIYSLQPKMNAPAQSRIRFPLWLKCLYNIAQMELTILDPLGAFYLVALDAGWRLRPQNINADGNLRLRPIITMDACGLRGQCRSRDNRGVHRRIQKIRRAAACQSRFARRHLCYTLNEINSKHQFGTESLAPLDLVKELKAMFGNKTRNRRYTSSDLCASRPLSRFSRLLQQHSSQLRISHFCWTYHSRAHPYRLLHSLHPAVHPIRCLPNYLDYSQRARHAHTRFSHQFPPGTIWRHAHRKRPPWKQRLFCRKRKRKIWQRKGEGQQRKIQGQGTWR